MRSALGQALLVCLCALPVAVLLAAPLPAAAGQELDATRAAGSPLIKEPWTWLDASGLATIEQVEAAPARFAPSQAGQLYPLEPGAALWMRLRLQGQPDAAPMRWLLELPVPTVDKATLYLPDGAGRWTARSAGDQVPVSRWPGAGGRSPSGVRIRTAAS